MLAVGSQAPDFALADQSGAIVRRSDFAGKKLVIYFYPRDNTPGCTREACAFRDAHEAFTQKNAAVIGISCDSAASHEKFAQKHALPFTLLSDPDHAVTEAFGAWQEKKLYGKTYMGTVRCAFVLDEQGTVILSLPKVKPDTSAADILARL
ncbi:MAG TPA: thioredoxin-dependent thiol peroxidase [Candidatus Treponema faecavium]|nr:thioredoxin-dependent thiol peroxidase [Candidatus Treponema faecavium]